MRPLADTVVASTVMSRSEEHTSELQSLRHLVCRLLLEKKKIVKISEISSQKHQEHYDGKLQLADFPTLIDPMIDGAQRVVRRLVFFFFNDTATTEIYTLSLHDALPISRSTARGAGRSGGRGPRRRRRS